MTVDPSLMHLLTVSARLCGRLCKREEQPACPICGSQKTEQHVYHTWPVYTAGRVDRGRLAVCCVYISLFLVLRETLLQSTVSAGAAPMEEGTAEKKSR